MITRRFFLARWLSALAAFVCAYLWGRGQVSSREIELTDADFVGKTRSGKFKQFYINYWKPMRRIDPARWKLEVTGLCENPGSFTLDEILSFPTLTRSSRLKCVECWSARAEWQGFRFAQLEKQVRPLASAQAVVFFCADSYTESLSLKSLQADGVLLVHTMDGKPLSDEHGFPLRVIIPSKYGYKNPKAILRMEFVSESQPGTWSRIGPYSWDGTILPGTDHPLEFGKIPRRIPGGEITKY